MTICSPEPEIKILVERVLKIKFICENVVLFLWPNYIGKKTIKPYVI